MRVDFDVFGEDKVAFELMAFGDRADAMQPALRAVADEIRSQTARRFDAEGPGWEPLAESTVLQKAALGHDPRILHATGRLRDSLTEPGGDHVEVITDSELIMASSVPYGVFHKTGTSRMPAREPVAFEVDDRREIVRTLQRYLLDGIAV